MANKFQKSVLERLEQEAAQQKAKPAAAPEPAKQEKPQPKPEETTSTAPAEPIAAVPEEEAPAANLPDLSAFLQQTPARQAKNKTFYLDTDVIDAIKAASKAQGITDSKLVNDILRHILLRA